MYRRIVYACLFVALVLAACVQVAPSTPAPLPPTLTSEPVLTPTVPSPTAVTTPTGGRTLKVMTHDSFSASKEVISKFEQECNCQVEFLKSGDAGLALNKAILSKGAPLADAFYGVDNTFLSRALQADICEPYASPALAGIPDDLKLDPTNAMLPVDFGYVTLNYDKAYFTDNAIPLPKTLRDLTDPAYKGLLVVENPATSSPGLAFLLTTIAVFGEEGNYTYLDFWRDLRKNDVFVADGWESAYYDNFSRGGKGDRPLVVSYATSPAAEVFFADPQPTESPTGNILASGESFRQIEFVCILRGAAQPELARQWVDFMLGETFQPDIPLQMWVYPARTGTPLPEVFKKFAEVPTAPAQIAPDQIEKNRDRWLQAWTDVVLR